MSWLWTQCSLYFETPPTAYTAEKILYILLDPNLNPDKICQERPTNVTHSATYVVDITKLHLPDDLVKDSFGKWNHSGSHTVPFHAYVHTDGFIEVDKCAQGATGKDVYYLKRLHSTHPSNPDFKRLIALISGKCIKAQTREHHLLGLREPSHAIPN